MFQDCFKMGIIFNSSLYYQHSLIFYVNRNNIQYVDLFTLKKVKVPKVNSSATTKWSCCGNVSI